MKKYLLIIFFILLFISCSEKSPDKIAKELIETTGTKQQISLFLDEFLKQVLSSKSDAIKGLIDVNELCERLIPIYTKHFTISEMQDIIDFFNSESGRKMISINPTLFKESSEIGRQYFKEKISAINEFKNSY